MCGRFNIVDDPLLRAMLDKLGISNGFTVCASRLADKREGRSRQHTELSAEHQPVLRWEQRFPELVNLAPTETIPVVLRSKEELTVRPMCWWLTPSWAPEISHQYSMFNAKSETLGKSRAFARPFRYRRAIVLASSFIEWKTEAQRKQGYAIRPTGTALVFAALWDRWHRQGVEHESCTLITTAADPGFSSLHARMPVMLAGEDIELWLAPDSSQAELETLFTPRLRLELEAWPLAQGINNARHHDPALLQPVGESQLFAAG